MLTPALQHCWSTSEAASFEGMFTQLCCKITEISQLKATICEKMTSQPRFRRQQKAHGRQFKLASETSQLLSFIKAQFSQSGIKSTLNNFWTSFESSSIEIANYYENQIKKCKNYYQAQVWDLREEIKRQYKVIALMKQEVQDLMVLMKYREGEAFNDSSLENMQQYEDVAANQGQLNEGTQETRIKSADSDNKNVKIKMNNNLRLSDLSNYQRDLEVIEEETERTLQSSERSNGNNNEHSEKMNNFIKIQQQSQNNPKEQPGDQIEQKSSEKQSRVQFSQNKADPQIFALDIDDYTAEITPKHTERVQKIEQEDLRFHTQKSLPIKTSHRTVDHPQNYYYHSSANLADDKPATSGRRSAKLHTAPADDRKSDHLQSIFFLDDEPDDYLNKTAKLKQMAGQKLSFFESHENSSSIRSLQHSQLTHGQQEQYPLIDDDGNRRIGQPHSKTLQNCNSDSEYDIKYSNQKSKEMQELFSSNVNDRKESKTARQLNQQETSEYIFKKFNKMIPVDYFQGSASVPVSSCSNGPLEQITNNANFDTDQRKSLENKPKTKQFLEQFRKTFNKCLKSMQVSKKNSTKLVNSSAGKHGGKLGSSYTSEPEHCPGSTLSSGVMTFGKNSGNTSNYSSNTNTHNHHSDQIKDKQNQKQLSESPSMSKSSTVKAVDHMLKELENNNKFLIGTKKLELKYEGDKKNNTRWGHGVLYYSNGLCYEGQFVNGCRHGYGLLKFNHIEIYNGDWKNDEMEGQGKIRNCAIINKRKTIYSNQTPLGKWISYSGEFRNSKFEGSGTLYLQGGEKFVGNFQNGYALGPGSLYKKNGQVELGHWRNNFQCEVPQKIMS